jgi:hypothetical protein
MRGTFKQSGGTTLPIKGISGFKLVSRQGHSEMMFINDDSIVSRSIHIIYGENLVFILFDIASVVD